MKLKIIALALTFSVVLGLNGVGQFEQLFPIDHDGLVLLHLSDSGLVCGSVDCTPDMAVDNNDIYAVWIEPVADSEALVIHFARSADEGDSFSTPRAIELTIGQNVRDPQIEVAANGDLVLIWTDDADGDFDVYASISTDQGNTWGWDESQDVYNISDNNGDSLHPTLAMGLDGTFVIAWSDDSLIENLNPEGFRNIFVCAGRLDDMAMTQTFNVSQGSVISSRYGADDPAIAVNPHHPLGMIFIAWQQEGARSDDVYFHQTTAFNPMNVSNLENVDANQVVVGIRNPSELPSPNEGEQVITIWIERVNGEDQVMLSLANDAGLPLTDPDFSATPVNLSQSDQSASNPALAINSNGNFFVAWTEEDESVRYRSTVQLVSMVDALGLPQEMSNSDTRLSASNASVSANDNSVFLIWVEENLNDGTANIVFTKQSLENIRIF